jgi:hypothetical protein
MLSAHEIFGFMSPALAQEIVEQLHTNSKEVYRAAVAAVAEARKVRPVFLERKPRVERNKDMAASLCKPNLETLAVNVLQAWLLKCQAAMLADFLNALGIAHKDGMVDDLPATMDAAKLTAAVESLLVKYPPQHVAVYLRAFNDLNQAKWDTLGEMLDKDARLQLGA